MRLFVSQAKEGGSPEGRVMDARRRRGGESTGEVRCGEVWEGLLTFEPKRGGFDKRRRVTLPSRVGVVGEYMLVEKEVEGFVEEGPEQSRFVRLTR